MPMMSRMRDLAPAFIVTVGVLFVLYMVISDSNVMEVFQSGARDVARINGSNISLDEFNKMFEQARENQKAQTGKDLQDEEYDFFREQVWEAIVSNKLTEQQVKDMGLFVSEKEIDDAIFGANPPDFLKKSFTDSTGNFNRAAYDQALKDKRNAEILKNVRNYLQQQFLNEKLQSVVNAAALVSEGEIRRRFIDDNIKMNADYAVVSIGSFSDSSMNVTSDEAKKYYEDNPDKFKQEHQRRIKYVVFNVEPSKGDSQSVFSSLESIKLRYQRDTVALKKYAEEYPDATYSKDTLNVSQIASGLAQVISNYQPGAVIGPVSSASGYELVKYLGQTDGKETFANASHILVKSTGNDTADLQTATKLYNELTAGANFAEYATRFSADPGSAQKGGDLGWFGKGAMVPEFENACFNGTVGIVQKPVKTSYGYHIIKVAARSNKKYAMERIAYTVKASGITRSNISQQAADFAYMAEKNGFEKEAESFKYKIEETQPFTKDAQQLPGLGAAKAIVQYAFTEDVNTISSVFKINPMYSGYNAAGGYTVFKIIEEIKEGVKKFEEIEKEAKALVAKEKKFEKAKRISENLKKQLGGDLSKAAQYNSAARFGQATQFTSNGSIPGIGLDFNVSAEAYRASKGSLNKVIGPIKGSQGYYLLKVTSVLPFDKNAYNSQRDGLRDRMLADKRGQLFNNWLRELKERAEIEDNRHKFFVQ